MRQTAFLARWSCREEGHISETAASTRVSEMSTKIGQLRPTRKKALAYQVYKKNTQPAQLFVP